MSVFIAPFASTFHLMHDLVSLSDIVVAAGSKVCVSPAPAALAFSALASPSPLHSPKLLRAQTHSK